MNENGNVQTLDRLRTRLKRLHDTQGLSWRKIAARREYEGIPHGTLWSIAHGREPIDAEQRKVLGLPPKTVEVEPCPDCGQVHTRLKQCDDERQTRTRHRIALEVDTPAEAAALRALLARYGTRRDVGRKLVDGTLTIVEGD